MSADDTNKQAYQQFPTEADQILRAMLKCGPYEQPHPDLTAFVREIENLVAAVTTPPGFEGYGPPFEKRLRSTQTVALAVATWQRFANMNYPGVLPVLKVRVPGTENLTQPGDAPNPAEHNPDAVTA